MTAAYSTGRLVSNLCAYRCHGWRLRNTDGASTFTSRAPLGAGNMHGVVVIGDDGIVNVYVGTTGTLVPFADAARRVDASRWTSHTDAERATLDALDACIAEVSAVHRARCAA